MPLDLRQQLLECVDLDIVPLTIDGWPDGLCVRLMTGEERDRSKRYFAEHEGDDKAIMAYVIATCLTDGDGRQLFDPHKQDDLNLLMTKSFRSLKSAWDRTIAHNGLDDEGLEDAKKNSNGTAT